MRKMSATALLALLIGVVMIFVGVYFHADEHEGQPEHCSNAKNAPKAHKCECSKEPGEDGEGCAREDKKCKTYCRPKACYCYQPKCDS